MQRVSSFRYSVLLVGVLSVCGVGFGQAKPAAVPDAQVEASVLKALAGAPQLADQAISSTTVYGTVTLSGTVRDEASRDLAEKIVSNTPGVTKVVDELMVGGGAAAANATGQAQPDASVGTNPTLQSDGTMAPGAPAASAGPAQATSNQYPNGNTQSAPPPQGGQYPQGQSAPYPQAQGPYRRPYAPAYPPQQPYVEQRGGDAVVVPVGSLLRVRINQGVDSKHTVPGTVLDGVMLSDVVAGGSIAIPRGASVQGSVVDVHKAGDYKGRGTVSLRLTQVTLGGRVYPVVSDAWTQQGADKTGETVGNTVGLSAVGAMIGAVAGGGVGAAIGAGVGGVAGLGVSSASGRGEAVIPSEAILNFRLVQPVELTTVSQAELNRLGAGLPPPQNQLRRRPPPPPGYYGPAYYRPY